MIHSIHNRWWQSLAALTVVAMWGLSESRAPGAPLPGEPAFVVQDDAGDKQDKADREKLQDQLKIALQEAKARRDEVNLLREQLKIAQESKDKALKARFEAEQKYIEQKGNAETAEARTKKTESNRILRERREVLKQIAELQVEGFQRGGASFDSVLLAQKDLLEADLELTVQRSERIEIFERLVNTMERFEELTQQRNKVGEATRADVLRAKAARLKAQAELIRERPEPKPVKE